MNHRAIVICGGVGPEAGIMLQRLILSNTQAQGIDQGHLDIHHFSLPGAITDRTQYILKAEKENPAIGMLRVIQAANGALQALDQHGAVGIPCCTFHADEIFSLFLNKAAKLSKRLTILNIMEETMKLLIAHPHKPKRIGILSTIGSRKTNVFGYYLEKYGLQPHYVDSIWQERIHNAIYHPKQGIKATSQATPLACEAVYGGIEQLHQKEVDAVILGCTELSLIFSNNAPYFDLPLIDPMLALARALIQFSRPDKLHKHHHRACVCPPVISPLTQTARSHE
ncbi:aspartate/glutamate racemase family protein [Magnetococcales bacterium HHB-1]